MKAILKEIEAFKYDGNKLRHPIKMLFAKSEESDELYHFGTTVEEQFCTTGEYDVKKGLSEEMFNEKVRYAKSLVGNTFEINLYKFTVEEMTGNKYRAFEFTPYYSEKRTIEEYHVAAYMSKEDVILNLKYFITIEGIQGVAVGVLADWSTEKITTELFFPKTITQKKNFDIPYHRYPNINTRYIVTDVSVNDIRKGRNLAYQIKDRDFPVYELDRYIHEIEDYRSKLRAAKMENESLRKKLFFWKPKVVVEELKLSPYVISLMKDCIILGKEYPSDCRNADREYAEYCEKQLRKKFMGEDTDEKDFKNRWIEFRKLLRKKYQGKSVIKVLTEPKIRN